MRFAKFFLLYSLPKLAAKYLRYYLTAANGKGHGMHSPFVFDLILHVLRDKRQYPEYKLVEALRKRLLRDRTPVVPQDLGAGSASASVAPRAVNNIARNAAKPPKYAQLLFRLAKYYQPTFILELGTSLGISTAYMALGCKTAKVTTIEGSSQIAGKARENLDTLSLVNVEVMEGPFEKKLPEALRQLSAPALVFIDGNHRLTPTLNYFYQVLPYMKSGSFIVFDDIHWSPEMEAAWIEIKAHPGVLLSVDLFFLGIVFFKKDFLIKQHFTIRF